MTYIFLGSNSSLISKLRDNLCCEIIQCSIFAKLHKALECKGKGINFCIFIERKEPAMDIPTIAQVNKKYPYAHIFLISDSLTKEEKLPYLKAGIDSMIKEDNTGGANCHASPSCILYDRLRLPVHTKAYNRLFEIVHSNPTLHKTKNRVPASSQFGLSPLFCPSSRLHVHME